MYNLSGKPPHIFSSHLFENFLQFCSSHWRKRAANIILMLMYILCTLCMYICMYMSTITSIKFTLFDVGFVTNIYTYTTYLIHSHKSTKQLEGVFRGVAFVVRLSHTISTKRITTNFIIMYLYLKSLIYKCLKLMSFVKHVYCIFN